MPKQAFPKQLFVRQDGDSRNSDDRYWLGYKDAATHAEYDTAVDVAVYELKSVGQLKSEVIFTATKSKPRAKKAKKPAAKKRINAKR